MTYRVELFVIITARNKFDLADFAIFLAQAGVYKRYEIYTLFKI